MRDLGLRPNDCELRIGQSYFYDLFLSMAGSTLVAGTLFVGMLHPAFAKVAEDDIVGHVSCVARTLNRLNSCHSLN